MGATHSALHLYFGHFIDFETTALVFSPIATVAKVDEFSWETINVCHAVAHCPSSVRHTDRHNCVALIWHSRYWFHGRFLYGLKTSSSERTLTTCEPGCEALPRPCNQGNKTSTQSHMKPYAMVLPSTLFLKTIGSSNASLLLILVFAFVITYSIGYLFMRRPELRDCDRASCSAGGEQRAKETSGSADGAKSTAGGRQDETTPLLEGSGDEEEEEEEEEEPSSSESAANEKEAD
ncbi:uncharacterized protein LOC142577797 isoform X2 [Dermacentor variabilis]|uniref:uncharacterized protein LOC142577797 isoform X2 n=1 Tax=Dermacentor variabilis TaxID=34621 RepID=UPI003F5C360D